MTKKIITTVGTSIFENYRQTFLNKDKSIDNAYDNLKNKKAKELNLSNTDVITLIGDEEDYGMLHSFLKGKVIKENKQWKEINDENTLNTHASAEISSIIKIYETENCTLKVRLLASDTVLSVLAAKLIKEWFDEAKKNDKYKSIEVIFNDNVSSPNADYIENLRTDISKEDLFDGFNNLIEKVIEISKDDKDNTLINITGGYKGFIPILTIIAQLEGLKLNYIYEDSDKLIEIGNLPIDFDWAIAEIYYQYLADTDLRKTLDKEDVIFKTLKNLFLINEQKKLTLIGTLFSKYIDKHLPQRQGVLGYYMEHKLFYTFFRNKYKSEYKSELIGRVFWWDKNNRTKYSLEPQYNKDKNKEVRVEIDIQLTNNSNDKIWIEAKSYKGLSKAINQIKKYIELNNEAVHEKLNELIIFIYKFDFQNLDKHKKNIENLKNYCKEKNLEFSLLYFDVPYNVEKNNINYKNVFEIEIDEKTNLHKF